MPALKLVFSTTFYFLVGSVSFASDFSAELAKETFLACQACHTMDGSTYQSIAPDLANITHRVAGTNKGFAYSEPMQAAGRDGLIWTEETLLNFLAKPDAMVFGTTMKFKGIRDEAERRNLVKWLLQASQINN